MSLLSDQLKEVNTELDLVLQSSENREAIGEIDQLIDELEPAYEKLNEICSIRKTLRSLPDGFAVTTSDEELVAIDSMKSVAYAFKVEWDEHGYRVRQKEEKVTFLTNIDNSCKQFGDNNKAAWRKFVKDLWNNFAVTPVELQSVRVVDRNAEKVSQFESLQEAFDNLQRQLPQSIDVIEKLQEIAKKLGKIRKNIKWNPPKAVKEFFQKLNTGVPLSELTPEVREWLENNNALTDLHITRRGNMWR